MASLHDWASHYIPIVRWLPGYKWRENLLGDLVAALTVTAVAAPEAVSYAGIAGLPGQQGLYTGLLGPLAYALTGASPQLMVGPTAIMCILTHNAIPLKWGGAAVAPCNPGQACATRVELAGLLALAMALLQALIGLLRLGSLVTLISQPVVVGFTTGSALLTASSQFSTLFALQTAGKAAKCAATDGAGEPIGCTFGQAVVDVFVRRATINWGVVALGCACIALLYGVRALPAALGKRFALLASLAPLVLVLLVIPLAYAYQDYLCSHLGQCVTPIPAGLPPLANPFATLAAGSSSDCWALLQAALPLAIIGYMSAVTIAKTISRQYGPYAVYADSELWGQVAANAACGLGSALPVTGSFSRSAVNCSSGARTGAASILTALTMALALLCLTHPLAYIPPVARSAIVLVAIGKMIELHLLAVFWAGERRDAAVFLVTLGVVLFQDSASGLVAGLAVQWLFALLRHSAEPTRVVLRAWVRGAVGAVGGAALPAAEAAVAAMRAQGMAWKEVTAQATLLSMGTAGATDSSSISVITPTAGSDGGGGGGGSGGSSAAAPHASIAPAFPHAAATLLWSPDLHFSSSERLSEAAAEAVRLFSPRVLVVSLVGVTPGAGLFLDATGASELLTLTHTLPSTCACLLYGLSERSLAQLHSTWQASQGSKGGSSGSGGSGAARAWGAACAGAVARSGGHCFGQLYVCASAAAADRASLEICAMAAAAALGQGGGKAAASAAGSLQGAQRAPLLSQGEDGEEEEEEEGGGEEGELSSGSAARRRPRKLGPVEGVAPSPLAVRSTGIRLANGLRPSLPPSQQMAHFKASVSEAEGQDKSMAAAAGRLAVELRDLAGQAVRYLSGEAPLLVAAVSEEE